MNTFVILRDMLASNDATKQNLKNGLCYNFQQKCRELLATGNACGFFIHIFRENNVLMVFITTRSVVFCFLNPQAEVGVIVVVKT